MWLYILCAQIGLLVSSSFISFSINWVILEHYGGSEQIGVYYALSSAPEMMFGYLGAILSDRIKFKKMVLYSLFSVAIISWSFWMVVHSLTYNILYIYGYAFVDGTVTALTMPFYLSAIPKVVHESQYIKANKVLTIGTSLTSLIVPVLSGVIIHATNPYVTVLVGAAVVTLMIPIVFLILLNEIPVHGGDVENEKDKNPVGLLEILLNKRVVSLLMLRAIGNLGFAPFLVFLAPWVKHVLREGPAYFGFLNSAMSFGVLIGGIFIPLCITRYKYTSILMSNILVSVSFVAFGLTRNLLVPLVIMLVIGYLISVEQILVDVSYQNDVPVKYLSKVSSVRMLMSQASTSSGEGFSGYLGRVFGLLPILLGGASVILLSSGVFYGLSRKISPDGHDGSIS